MMLDKDTLKRRILKALNTLALVLLAFVIGLYSSQFPIFAFILPNVAPQLPNVPNASLYTKVWDILHSDYYSKKMSNNTLLYSSISGMVSSLNDPATIFLSPSQEQSFSKASSGNTFAGVGIQLGYDSNGNIIIARIVPGGPASSSPLRPNEELVSVNGTSISGSDITKVSNEIRGTAGTAVSITAKDMSTQAFVNATLSRQPIHVESVYVTQMTAPNGDSVDDIVVTRFTDSDLPTWENAWNSAIQQVLKDNPKGIVIDLRDNPGGFFDAAVFSLADFLPKQTLVAMQQGRDGTKKDFYTQTSPTLPSVKLTVLVNANTASAAEIFSGALQYYHRALIIGENTYGKGTAQEVLSFTDGSSLHVTTDHWLLPTGRWIQKTDPIHPDIQIDFTSTDFQHGNDTQMNKALSIL